MATANNELKQQPDLTKSDLKTIIEALEMKIASHKRFMASTRDEEIKAINERRMYEANALLSKISNMHMEYK